MPPRCSCSSKIATSWPLARELVRARQAGRAAADHRDLLAGRRCGGAANASLFAIAYSPRKCSTELMPTWSSTSLRLQPVSHGAGQTRPITDGNGLASVSRRHAYSCHWSTARRRLLDAAHDVEVAADVLAGRAAALARRRRLDVGRALVRVARLEDLLAPRLPLRVAVLVAAEGELFGAAGRGSSTSPGLRKWRWSRVADAGQCLAPSRIAVLTSWCTPPTMPILKP